MQGLKATTIEQVLALPDEEIDIATAILLLSKQWDNTVDVEKYRRQIDEMATLLKPIVAKAQTPDTIVKAINDYIFRKFKDVPGSAIVPIITSFQVLTRYRQNIPSHDSPVSVFTACINIRITPTNISAINRYAARP